jgi:D-alanyl-lipoteichoic acid acyltransferase DltB (MBOAT superfamily)
MLFNSVQYIAVFFPLVFLGCLLLRRLAGPRAAQAWILAASLFFYSFLTPRNLTYLLGSILANWLIIRVMDRAPQPARKRWMQLGLVLNIVYLCTFKYVNFFLGVFAFMLPGRFHLPELEFPLGISFFTLTQIMYLVDVYEEIMPAMNLFDSATFVSFFPYVISGPIAKAKRMKHQFGDFGGKQGQQLELFSRGLFQFTIGLFKKVLFADVFAKLANVGFVPGLHLSAAEAWAFSIAYTLQLYFDFSGYSDMAMGAAFMLGIEIPRNFDAPLRSKSIIEFWTRWHISLSQFITAYLYTPISRPLRKMSRNALLTSAIATFFAMTVAGLWHGPAWTFVLYGIVHGTALAVNQFWRRKQMPVLPAFPSWFLTFCVVLVALIFFRAENVHDGVRITASLFNPWHPLETPLLMPTVRGLTAFNLLLLPLGVLVAFAGKSSVELAQEFKPTLANAFGVGMMFVTCCIFMAFNMSQSFLYFQF